MNLKFVFCSKFIPEIRDFAQRSQDPSILRPSLCGLATTRKRETCFVHTAIGTSNTSRGPLAIRQDRRKEDFVQNRKHSVPYRYDSFHIDLYASGDPWTTDIHCATRTAPSTHIKTFTIGKNLTLRAAINREKSGMAYAKIENGILWKIGLLPKAQRLTFIQLKIHSNYTTHITQPFSYRELVEKTGLDLRSVKRGIP